METTPQNNEQAEKTQTPEKEQNSDFFGAGLLEDSTGDDAALFNENLSTERSYTEPTEEEKQFFEEAQQQETESAGSFENLQADDYISGDLILSFLDEFRAIVIANRFFPHHKEIDKKVEDYLFYKDLESKRHSRTRKTMAYLVNKYSLGNKPEAILIFSFVISTLFLWRKAGSEAKTEAHTEQPPESSPPSNKNNIRRMDNRKTAKTL